MFILSCSNITIIVLLYIIFETVNVIRSAELAKNFEIIHDTLALLPNCFLFLKYFEWAEKTHFICFIDNLLYRLLPPMLYLSRFEQFQCHWKRDLISYNGQMLKLLHY